MVTEKKKKKKRKEKKECVEVCQVGKVGFDDDEEKPACCMLACLLSVTSTLSNPRERESVRRKEVYME